MWCVENILVLVRAYLVDCVQSQIYAEQVKVVPFSKKVRAYK
jgi:hypothetical protein